MHDREGTMRQVGLLMIFTAIKISVVVYAQGDECHDCFEWLVFKFDISISIMYSYMLRPDFKFLKLAGPI